MNTEYLAYNDDHREDLIEMIMSLYAEDPCSEGMSRKQIENTISFLSANPGSGRIIMISDSGKIIGYSIIVYFWSNEYGGHVLLIDELFIRKEYRSKGAGAGFMKYLIANESQKCKAVFLEVIPSNTRALEFYRKAGFREHKNRFQRLLLGKS